ncbi:hypothetical protein BAUCODRAFT_333299 [Baudoinia panamericana UAMH 10762]|uniref:Uncharacterized protein n=1 Tax=Baudoinia panamericana (strain UAMH 10762) TaxID=717646 RepID=M2M3D0_BAUPA|nr:uncharacterized protein BAUCODRAFT_333299 [Baudoinia panamericana UAMH 10762]EMC91026.1 hypothetical protein BAUCODRAFT_333299 [Baudoinia panamericana UAMH 10762]
MKLTWLALRKLTKRSSDSTIYQLRWRPKHSVECRSCSSGLPCAALVRQRANAMGMLSSSLRGRGKTLCPGSSPYTLAAFVGPSGLERAETLRMLAASRQCDVGQVGEVTIGRVTSMHDVLFAQLPVNHLNGRRSRTARTCLVLSLRRRHPLLMCLAVFPRLYRITIEMQTVAGPGSSSTAACLQRLPHTDGRLPLCRLSVEQMHFLGQAESGLRRSNRRRIS